MSLRLHKLKWLILTLSGLTFLYLLYFNFSTINDHKDFHIYLQKLKRISADLTRKGWDDSTVSQWQQSLEIQRKIEWKTCDFNNVVVGLPGDSIDDHLWEYASLLVLKERWKSDKNVSMGVFLAPQTRRALVDILDEVHIDSLETYPSGCLDLKHANILGHVNSVEVEKTTVGKPRLFLLEKGAKRYKELSVTDLSQIRSYFVLNDDLLQEMKQSVFELREFFSRPNDTDDVFLVGLHLGNNRIPHKVPENFYRMAIQSVKLWHEDVGVLVICPGEKMKFCEKTFDTEDPVKIIRSGGDQAKDFALLTLCDGNILHSDLGFLAALLNDGETVVHQSHPPDNDPAVHMAHSRPRWLTLEN
ncbi:uncharacterized protein LOC132262737 [Phlebotomus argentipes]|uniref:uncharacterized protein LOC132262737 n=1 Tax=Phlebotomus argentipes TaxID=94469 RepID=UPI0028936184|nr:uncharacterized protein LOC132262737 [Phlebotomus argentipes]